MRHPNEERVDRPARVGSGGGDHDGFSCSRANIWLAGRKRRALAAALTGGSPSPMTAKLSSRGNMAAHARLRDRHGRLHRLPLGEAPARGRASGRRLRRHDALLRSCVSRRRAAPFCCAANGFRDTIAMLEDMEALTRAAEAGRAGRHRPSRRAGGRALQPRKSARLCRRQSRRRLQRHGDRARAQAAPSADGLDELGLWREPDGALSRERANRSSADALRRDEESRRGDGAFLCASVVDPDDDVSLLHRLRPVGPTGHGAVEIRRRDRERPRHRHL